MIFLPICYKCLFLQSLYTLFQMSWQLLPLIIILLHRITTDEKTK